MALTPENDKQVIELNRASVFVLRLRPLTADPVDLEDGDMWHRGDTDALHIYLNGVKKTVTVS